MRKELLAAVFITLLFSAASVRADMLSYDFSTPAGPLGTSQTYTSNGVTITASGYTLSGHHRRLFGKTDSGDEHGLGLKGEDDHEIDTKHFIQLNLASLYSHFGTSSLTVNLTIGSVQPGEGYDIYGTNTAGSLAGATLLNSGTLDEIPFSVTTGFQYLDVIARPGTEEGGHSDVLLSSLCATSAVPEPAGLILFGVGALGLAGCAWRQRKRATDLLAAC